MKAELMELDMELKNLAMAETFVSGEKHSQNHKTLGGSLLL